jgi:type VI secretion system protein ImpM
VLPDIEVGFYGKLPSHGDFLRRRVSDAFIGVWDAWLQECLTASRAALGSGWLDVYLTSPAWRFACAAGTFGATPVVGLMVPSVDRVGRYFHLTLADELPDDADVVGAASSLDGFFDRAERLAIATLEAERVDFDAFDQAVSSLGAELSVAMADRRPVMDPLGGAILHDTGPAFGWQVPMGTTLHLSAVWEQLLSRRLTELYDPLVLWWTEGSAVVEPSCLITKGLPPADTFAALLDGAWTEHHWRSIPPGAEPALEVDDPRLADEPLPPRFRSAGVTDVGKVRRINQDSFLERPEVGLWVVADGLGGHSDGEVASRMVCDALADFVPDASFEQMLEAASARIQQVNSHLARASMREHNAVRSGSTVVTLLTRGTRCAVLWAGDSRLYRLRDGSLEQLTRDHSLVEESGGDVEAHASTAITRAVGGELTLALDLYRDRVRIGDRFLLCSDGLTRAVPAPQIQEWMRHESIRAAVDGLLKTTLDAGAPDNVTVVIVEAYA